MHTILLFGAGKSSTVLIDYLLKNASEEDWKIIVVDADLSLAKEKLGDTKWGEAISFDIANDELRRSIIEKSNLVISLLPPSMHILVAKDCIQYKKHFLTASYIDDEIKKLTGEIERNDLLFLCEMGLDPGIDHMSAKKLIDDIQSEGGKITSFLSHCGGLVAEENDDNPWHYKISWNPRNVVMAGKAGAHFKQNGAIQELDYTQIFSEKRFVSIPGHEQLCWYPNRDSLRYASMYGLENTTNFIRTTLRHPDFIYGWKNIIDLKLTDEEKVYNTNGKSLAQWFKEHMDKNNFSDWLTKKMHEQFDSTKNLLSELVNLVKLEEEAAEKGVEHGEEFMMVTEEGDLKEVDIDYLKISAATTLADTMHDANLILKQLFYLGLNDLKTIINSNLCSAADVLQLALEKKLPLEKGDKDLVIMLHEIEFEKSKNKYKATSTLMLKGEDAVHTAMAKTVGLPLGIAAKLILNGTIKARGLHIPISKDIYQPLLQELEIHNIIFKEETNTM